MKIYVDSESKIRDVGSTKDTSLKELYINDSDNPFKGWSTAKICCYKVNVENGIVTMLTPYIDSRSLDMVDTIGRQVDKAEPYTATQSASCGDTEVVFEDVPQGILSVNMVDSEGENIFPFRRREGNDVIVEFEPLEYAADVTISIQ